jgi:hypothetical protein
MQGYGLDRAGSGYGQMAGTCKRGNKPSSSIKCGECIYIYIYLYRDTCVYIYIWGMRWRRRLRHCATSRKVAGLIADGVIGIFCNIIHNPSGCTVALGLTQPLTEMSTRNISWGVNAAGAQGCPPYHLQAPNVLKSESLNLLEPSGPVQACNGIALPLLLHTHTHTCIYI